MGKQKEGSLQERIQKLIVKRGGYCFKNHGDMTTEPGRPDIVCCYKGLFVAIEAKVDNNKPSAQQGIHCRNIWKAGGIACIVWSIEEVDKLLLNIEYVVQHRYSMQNSILFIHDAMREDNLDDGTRW